MMNTDENASEPEEMDTKEEDPSDNMVTNGSHSPKENEDVTMEEDTARAEGTITLTVPHFSKMDKPELSDPIYVRNLPWRIMLMPRTSSHGQERVKSLGFFLQCDPKLETVSWSCQASAKLTLKNHHEDKEDFSRKISHLFYAKENDWGFSHFLTWAVSYQL
ncbi:ubiquitin carboxyl-terminal hydrolase 7-like [Actinia tenebrosa]|uniref:Ubiquitin carboxyl-terminal hydrolase 7-like n=1 Tax=Actinia tenebrosa TaxID=6105 RepID=A0A6P8IMX9_ACTTE|nr:ubiquitin carboxyl-terminal hydrolase 7-like [Actinia tenebrosa]